MGSGGLLIHPSALPVWLLLNVSAPSASPAQARRSDRAGWEPPQWFQVPPHGSKFVKGFPGSEGIGITQQPLLLPPTAAPPLISRADGHLLFLGHISTRSSSVVDALVVNGEETTRDE